MSPIGIAPEVVGVAADDLTGANDSVVQFARAGWSSRLALGDPQPGTVGPSSVLAVVTDARALNAGAAREATGAAVARLVDAGADHLYLKIDSTMRGSAAAQIEGALGAWQRKYPGAFAVVCPAYPAMGRTVQNGLLRINGVPVEDTSIGRDPVTPVHTGEMGELIPGSTSVRLQGHSTTGHVKQLVEAADGGTPVVSVDAVTDSGLELLAAAVGELGPKAVPVGSAGLARAMAAVWADRASVSPEGISPEGTSDRVSAGADPWDRVPGNGIRVDAGSSQEGRILVVVSSLNDTSRGQVDRLMDTLPPEDLLVLRPGLAEVADRSVVPSWVERQLPLGALPPVVMILSPVHRSSRSSVSGAEIAEGLAAIAETVLAPVKAGALVLIGGDGARAVLNVCGARSILVFGAIEEGVPVGVVEGGRAAGLTVATKAGGFGQPDSLVNIVRNLIGSTRSSKEAFP